MIQPYWLDSLLAKSIEKSVGDEAETLSQHTWNVLQKLASLIHLRPTLPQQIGEPHLWHCLFWACLLHDLGKSASGFQNVLIKKAPRWPQRHEVLSLAFTDWLFPPTAVHDRLWVTAAIASHHKDADYLISTYPDDLEEEDDIIPALLSEISDGAILGIWDWLNQCSQPWVHELNLDKCGIEFPALIPQGQAIANIRKRGVVNIHLALQSLQSLEDAMRKDPKHPMRFATILLRGHLITADHMASAHVGELPKSQLADPDRLLAGWKLNLAQLYDHQRDSLTARGSAVLMAPTGSGKTEAALLWAVAQAQPNQPVPRLYYTLPFQASMNAMEKRLNEDQGDQRAPFPGQVGLEHSRSKLAYYRKLLEDNYSPKAAVKEAKWLDNLARLNYYPVRILSPYQLLKGPYRLKGYETLLTDCFGGVFIFDEIHAYEAKRLAKILATVKYLRENYAARFFVMSATLPKLLRDQLADALGEYQLIEASAATYAQFRRHALMLKDGDLLDEPNLRRIARVAESGQAVLVCCNTVARAQQAWQGLSDRLKQTAPQIKVELLHGRFNGKDRLDKEQIVRDATGARSTQRNSAIVLVATQVVEVSLDIDLDVIYTDPAPLEALLQRFGRINRRRLKECAPVCVFREPVPDKERPYDPSLIQAALRVLEKNQDRLIDEAQISHWLDEVYADADIAGCWLSDYQSAYTEFAESTLSTLRAFQSDDELEQAFYKAFDSVEVLPADLSDRFESLWDEEPLQAYQLLVPIRWWQWSNLQNKGLTREDEKRHIKEVLVHYDSQFGLDFTRDYRDDEDL